eukprot:gene15474-biopygen8168
MNRPHVRDGPGEPSIGPCRFTRPIRPMQPVHRAHPAHATGSPDRPGPRSRFTRSIQSMQPVLPVHPARTTSSPGPCGRADGSSGLWVNGSGEPAACWRGGGARTRSNMENTEISGCEEVYGTTQSNTECHGNIPGNTEYTE